MAKTPKTMVELINETAEEDEEEIAEDLASVATTSEKSEKSEKSIKSEKSSNYSAVEISNGRESGKEKSSGASEASSAVKEEENGHANENGMNGQEEDYENETFEYESNFEVEIRSTPPSNLPDGVHLFNVSLLNSALDGISFPPMRRRPFKNGTRQSYTFTNDQMWEIERQNRHIMERIFHPSGSGLSLRAPEHQSNSRTASAAINRKKRDRQIQLDNQVLHRKLEAIKSRRPK